MELTEFYKKIPESNSLSSSQLIPYFMYYLHLDEDVVTANKIKACFDTLKIKAYSNISGWLGNNSKGKNAILIRYKTGYTLTRSCSARISSVVKVDMKFDTVGVHSTVKENELKEIDEVTLSKVFIVHGHDDLAKEQVARAIEKAGFEAIILHEKASGGKTIIEKIEKYSDVSFAVVLYTPCDLGRDRNSEEDKFRARQNVVFEHGYLISRLGREHVCALVKGDTETPGDVSGVVYVQMDDAGAWKMSLAKEMELAGLKINYNNYM
jgi:predicted nucleotide-binding protein